MISKRKDFCKNYPSNPNIEIFKEIFKELFKHGILKNVAKIIKML